MNNNTPPRAPRGALDRYVEIKTAYGPLIAYGLVVVGAVVMLTGVSR